MLQIIYQHLVFFRLESGSDRYITTLLVSISRIFFNNLRVPIRRKMALHASLNQNKPGTDSIDASKSSFARYLLFFFIHLPPCTYLSIRPIHKLHSAARGVLMILILWVMSVNKIFIYHPQFFPTVLKCRKISIAPVLNTPLLHFL